MTKEQNIEAENKTVRIIPLGGLEQIGMNITAYRYADSIIVVDCGLAFPSDDMPGVDLVVPDVTYLKEHAEMVKGIFITHGHEDHIGALPYILSELNVPIYATRLTLAIIEDKLEEHHMLGDVKRHVVSYGERVTAGDFTVEFIKTNHSIADSASFAIFSPVGTIIHTGDFKVDYTPVFGDHIDLQRLGELGNEGVLALVADSTNAIREGFTPSERRVAETFNTIFSEYREKRIMIATFASNVDRVQQIINSVVQFGRKLAIVGRSMVNIVALAKSLGYITCPDDVLIDAEDISKYPDEKLAIIMTGSQGETMAALSRVAAGRDSKLSISANDVVIFSSSPIPGNEKAVNKLINELSILGAKIINRSTHVSGHACAEELKLIYALTKPEYAVPVHGEFRHRDANADIAKEMQVDPKKVFMLNSGDVLELSEAEGKIVSTVPHGGIMVDGLGVGDVGSIVLRDRQNLSQDGIIVVCVAIDEAHERLLSGPEIISRGFVYVRENENIMENAKEVARQAVENAISDSHATWPSIKAEIKESLSSYFWQIIKRSPVILPIIMEIPGT